MARRGPRDRCPRTGKAKFTTWDDAAGAAHRVDGDDAWPYTCQHCGKFHITGNETGPDGQKRKKK